MIVMPLCGTCQAKDDVRAVRKAVTSGAAGAERDPFRTSANPKGWHYEREQHAEAARGNKVRL